MIVKIVKEDISGSEISPGGSLRERGARGSEGGKGSDEARRVREQRGECSEGARVIFVVRA